MRIILVQAEIELALRAYVLNQISVREGQEITIAFKNTRGDDGATAEIDISTPSYTSIKVPSTPLKRTIAPAPVEAPVTASEPDMGEDTSDPSDGSPAPAVEAESDTTASEEAVPVQDASTTSEADTAAETVNQKEEEPVANPVSKPASFLKPTVQSSDEAPAPSKSLFANLTKPVNPKPE